jgi:hypothetical protein
VRRLNARCARAWEGERASLRPLPTRRTTDFEEIDARVSKFGVFSAKSVLYSVPSRLTGHRLKVRLHSAHVEAWLAGVKVFECERLYGSTENRHPKRIDWRHMLPSLKRKPGAFARWVLRDAIPAHRVRPGLGAHQRTPARTLGLPADGRAAGLGRSGHVVAELAGVLAALHERDELPDIDALRERFAPRPTLMPTVQVVMPAAAVYDELLEAA